MRAMSSGESQSRLRDDADLEAAPLEEARDEDRPERRVIDVRVAGDDEDVELLPAARVHLLARRREESPRANLRERHASVGCRAVEAAKADGEDSAVVARDEPAPAALLDELACDRAVEHDVRAFIEPGERSRVLRDVRELRR